VPSVLHVINDVPYWLHHRKALARRAQEQGFSVSLAAPADLAAVSFPEGDIPFFPIEIDRFSLNRRDLSLFLKMRGLFANGRFDIVHLMTIKPLLIGGLAAASLQDQVRPTVIGTVAGLGRAFAMDGLRRRLMLNGLSAGLGRSATAVTFENPGDASTYVSTGILQPIQVEVLKGAGVDLAQYFPAARERSAPLRFLFASRLLKAKGICAFVIAAREAKRRFGDAVQFSVAGVSVPGEPDGLTQAEIDAIIQEPAIEWLGAVPGSDMPELLRACDVFVLPTQYPEGMPRSLLEAGACGLAVIAGDVAGTRALIAPNRDGILLADCEAATVFQAIEKLVDDAPLRRRLGAALLRKVHEDGFGLDAVNDTFVQLYRRVLASKNKTSI
jgi:glycosyltransferase involved in cell wall biosynthesis